MDPMNEEPDVYHAYLLRLWRTLCQGQTQWRASLESPHTGERHVFASPEQFFMFMRDVCEAAGQEEAERRGEGDTVTRRHGDTERRKYENESSPG